MIKRANSISSKDSDQQGLRGKYTLQIKCIWIWNVTINFNVKNDLHSAVLFPRVAKCVMGLLPWLILQERALWMNLSCFHQGVLKPVIYEHLHVDGLKLFTLVKGDLCWWMIPMSRKRPRTRSLIRGTAARDESSGDRQAEQENDPSNERCAEAGHGDHQSTLPAGKRRRTAERTPCWSRRDRTAHYDMKVRANQRIFTH